MWCFASSDGYLFHVEPYCGSDTKLKETELGQGADVVLGLIEKCNLPSGSSVTFDNLFTSLTLLNELTKQGIGGLGTIRQNRLENAAVSLKKNMKKTESGTYDCAINNHKNAVVTWHDTAIVTCTSNYTAALPKSSVLWWSKIKKNRHSYAKCSQTIQSKNGGSRFI